MKKQTNILFITQKRNDAIGIVDDSIKKELKSLKPLFDFLEIHEKGKSTFKVIVNYIRNFFLLWRKCFKYDTLYFTWENPYVIFVRLIYWRKKIIMTVHHVEDYRGKSIVGRLMIKSTNKFIAISNFTKNQLIGIGAKEKDIFVNYNGISDVYYPEPIKDFTNYKYILYVGTEAPRKNTDLLLEVFAEIHKKYPSLKLVKIGKPGSEQDKIRFDNKIKELKLEDSVIIKRDFVEDDDLRKWYSNALCYISLSKLEGFGLTIPEAMACGCPVIASDIGPFREICGDDEMLVNLDDKNTAIEGIEKYINNSKFRSNQAKEGLKISKKFNRKSNALNLINVVKD